MSHVGNVVDVNRYVDAEMSNKKNKRMHNCKKKNFPMAINTLLVVVIKHQTVANVYKKGRSRSTWV
jgi:hypothetical protein